MSLSKFLVSSRRFTGLCDLLGLLILGSLMAISWGLPARALDTRIGQAQWLQLELDTSRDKVSQKSLRVKDVHSGRIAQVQLSHATKGESNYQGFFVIQFFAGDQTPRELEFSEAGKPPYFVYAIDSNGNETQKIKLFETAAQLEAYRRTQIAEKPKAAVVATKPVSGKIMAQAVREKSRNQEKVQLSLEEELVRKRMRLMEENRLLGEATKKAKIEKAAGLVGQADRAYATKDYEKATQLYSEALKLQPEADSYYYRYGVSLYKVGQYNESLATLSVAEAPENSTEKNYYIALNHLKLQDFVKARKEMIEVRDEKNSDVSPYAAFFAGNLDIQQQNFPSARENMQYVLDNSKDPSLDRAADQTLEQIDQLERYYDSKKEKFRFSLFGGLIYDSNILNVAANNIATDVKGYRFTYGVSALGIWYRSMVSDFGTQIAVSDYYSFNSRFQGEATLQTSDPLTYSLTAPFHREWMLSQRALRWELVPGLYSTYMAPLGGARKEIIRSMGASSSLSFPLQSDLLLSGRLDYSNDKSYLDVASANDDQSGSKMGFTLTPVKILDLRGEKSLSADLTYYLNNLNGANYKSNRWGLGMTYGFPSAWSSQGSLRLDYSNQKYPEASVPRTDKITALTLASLKDLNKNWNMLLSFQYSTSASEVDAYKYDKYILTSLFTYTTSILGK